MNGDRVAAIDIGTNTVLLTVAEKVSGGELLGKLHVLEEGHAITRLGQGVDETGKLDPEASARTLDCLRRYRADIDRLGAREVCCVGTSALRDAAEGGRFLEEAAKILGTEVEVISGIREAELTFRGAWSSWAKNAVAAGEHASDLVLCFDIGGGSTELVLGTRDGSVLSTVSVNVGSVRLYERHGEHDLARAESTVRAAMPPAFEHAPLVVGIAGTMTTLWGLEYGMPFDEARAATRPLTSETIARFARELFAMPVEVRRSALGIHEGRADVIPFGALVASEVLRWASAPTAFVTSRGVRYGLLLER